jgi:hypothetical protein
MKKIFLLLMIIKTNLRCDDQNSKTFISKKITVIELIHDGINFIPFYKNPLGMFIFNPENLPPHNNDNNNIDSASDTEENKGEHFLDEIYIKINRLTSLLEIANKNQIDSFEQLKLILKENIKILSEYNTLIKICKDSFVEIDRLIYLIKESTKKTNLGTIDPQIKNLQKFNKILDWANEGKTI